MPMIERFLESDILRIEAIRDQLIVAGQEELAREIDEHGELIEIEAGSEFISQASESTEVYLILSGQCDVVVNGRTIAKRGAGCHVGEMAAVQPRQKRSASCIASEDIVAIQLLGRKFSELGSRYPSIYKTIAKELARRLLERNSTISAYREEIRVFVISSVEALPVARAIQSAFEHDPFITVVWTDGVFKVANYTLQDLGGGAGRFRFCCRDCVRR